MNTNRQGRHSRQRSENLLDGSVPVTEPLSQLLHNARRVPPGMADGEADVIGAYRWSQQASSAVQTTLVLDRGPWRGAVAVRRFVAAKVLAAAAVTVTLGGVALAATMHGDPVPVAASTSTQHSSGPAAAGAVDSDTPSTPTAPAVRKSATPDRAPAALKSTKAVAAPGRTDDDAAATQRLTKGERVRMSRICRAWVADEKRGGVARERSAEEIYRAAGGKEKALDFCVEVVRELCEPWRTKGRPAWQCPYTLEPKNPPVVAPTRPGPAPAHKTTMPFPVAPGDPEPGPVITGGPVVNREAD